MLVVTVPIGADHGGSLIRDVADSITFLGHGDGEPNAEIVVDDSAGANLHHVNKPGGGLCRYLVGGQEPRCVWTPCARRVLPLSGLFQADLCWRSVGSSKFTHTVRGCDGTNGGTKSARREQLLKRFSFMCRASSIKAWSWHRVKNAAKGGKFCNGRREGNWTTQRQARKDTSLTVPLNRQARRGSLRSGLRGCSYVGCFSKTPPRGSPTGAVGTCHVRHALRIGGISCNFNCSGTFFVSALSSRRHAAVPPQSMPAEGPSELSLTVAPDPIQPSRQCPTGGNPRRGWVRASQCARGHQTPSGSSSPLGRPGISLSNPQVALRLVIGIKEGPSWNRRGRKAHR